MAQKQAPLENDDTQQGILKQTSANFGFLNYLKSYLELKNKLFSAPNLKTGKAILKELLGDYFELLEIDKHNIAGYLNVLARPDSFGILSQRALLSKALLFYILASHVFRSDEPKSFNQELFAYVDGDLFPGSFSDRSYHEGSLKALAELLGGEQEIQEVFVPKNNGHYKFDRVVVFDTCEAFFKMVDDFVHRGHYKAFLDRIVVSKDGPSVKVIGRYAIATGAIEIVAPKTMFKDFSKDFSLSYLELGGL